MTCKPSFHIVHPPLPPLPPLIFSDDSLVNEIVGVNFARFMGQGNSSSVLSLTDDSKFNDVAYLITRPQLVTTIQAAAKKVIYLSPLPAVFHFIFYVSRPGAGGIYPAPTTTPAVGDDEISVTLSYNTTNNVQSTFVASGPSGHVRLLPGDLVAVSVDSVPNLSYLGAATVS